MGGQGLVPWGQEEVSWRTLDMACTEPSKRSTVSSPTYAQGGEEAGSPGWQGSGLYPPGPNPGLGASLLPCLLLGWITGMRSPWKAAHCWAPAAEVLEKEHSGNSLVVQWLGLRALTAEGLVSIPAQGTKIPQAVWCGQKKRERTFMP